jgi:hypothetical protein
MPGHITHSVRLAYAQDFLNPLKGHMRLAVLPEDMKDILLLSRSDILDKVSVAQEEWISRKLVDVMRLSQRRRGQTLARRFVSTLMDGVYQEQAKSVTMGLPVYHDDASFAALHIRIQ